MGRREMEGVGKGMKPGELGGDGGAGERGAATLGDSWRVSCSEEFLPVLEQKVDC